MENDHLGFNLPKKFHDDDDMLVEYFGSTDVVWLSKLMLIAELLNCPCKLHADGKHSLDNRSKVGTGVNWVQ